MQNDAKVQDAFSEWTEPSTSYHFLRSPVGPQVDLITVGSGDCPLHRGELGAVPDLWAHHGSAAR